MNIRENLLKGLEIHKTSILERDMDTNHLFDNYEIVSVLIHRAFESKNNDIAYDGQNLLAIIQRKIKNKLK